MDSRFGAGVDARVTAYVPSSGGMQQVSPTKETGPWGQVELSFPNVFDGVFQLEVGADALDPIRLLASPGPFFRDARLAFNPIARDNFPAGDAHVIRDVEI
jgi:hypothetical protein